jgi:hypothetical protein
LTKRDSKKSFQVSETETKWGGFLIDEDAQASLPFFDRAIKAAAHDDPDIVQEAWEKCQTIVTSNRRDFLHYIEDFQNPRTTKNAATCGDCSSFQMPNSTEKKIWNLFSTV